MAWSFNNDKPIYLQIAEHIQIDIINGKYVMGEKLPSIRGLALDASVNPNTMQKSLSELETSEIVISQRTSGYFVTENSEIISVARKTLADNLIADFFAKITKLGYTTDEAISLILKEKQER